MAKETTRKENPLLSKNIPQPPASSVPTDSYSIASVPQSGNAVIPQNTVLPRSEKREKITFYLEPELANKLYDLMEDYRRRTGIKINQQDMLRRILGIVSSETVIP